MVSRSIQETREKPRGAKNPPSPGSTNAPVVDRKSTRLNSSHSQISYAVFCLKKKKKTHSLHNAATQHSTSHLPNLLRAWGTRDVDFSTPVHHSYVHTRASLCATRSVHTSYTT